MPPPNARQYLQTLVGGTIYTPTERRPNTVVSLDADTVLVRTADSPAQPVRISEIQAAIDRVWAGEEVLIRPQSVGYRSSFIGAVLDSLPDVEVLGNPPRARRGPGEHRVQPKAPGRNPPWEYDELILALDLYLRRGQPPTSDPDVVALSDLLNRLPIHTERPDRERFRNPNGVHMKLGNFKAPDPSYEGRGLSAGGRGVYEVWARFATDPGGLTAAVTRIRAAAADGDGLPPEEYEAEAVEGRILFRWHRARERNPAVVKRKKASVLRRTGRLACEVCDVDFSERYGDLGEGFIECHHTLPLATGSPRITRLADLAVVCPNCHRMLHRAKEPLSVESLRGIVRGSARRRGQPIGPAPR